MSACLTTTTSGSLPCPLAVGDDVLSAHGDMLTKVQRKLTHPHQQVLEARVDAARLRVTSNHRVHVPSGGERCREAIGKKVGELVVWDFSVTRLAYKGSYLMS